MKLKLFTLLVMTTLCTSLAFATPPQIAKAGKYTVELTTRPSPPTVGASHITVTVKDAGKLVTGAIVKLHLDMTAMSMPEDDKTTPGAQPGQYVATVDLSMAGEWKLTAAVQSMAGMAMPGDGKATFSLMVAEQAPTPPINLPTPSGAPVNTPWLLIIGVLVIIGVCVLLLVARSRSNETNEE